MRAPEIEHSTPLGFRIWGFANYSRMKAPHTHADIELNFLVRGALRYRHGGRNVTLERGKTGFFWGGIPHQLLETEPATEGVLLTLPISWFVRWRLSGNLTNRLLAGEFIRGDGDQSLLARWRMDFASGEPARLRVLQVELEAMFHRVGLSLETRAPRTLRQSRESEAGGLRIEKVTTYLATGYHEDLSLSKIAEAMGVHPKYLARAFKKYCGLSVWDYLTRLRVAHAQRLLLTTDLKIIDVALESGFGSVAPFYAAFARHGGGRSPGGFRRNGEIFKE